MIKKQSQAKSTYATPHPQYEPSKDRKWLEGRMKHPTGFCSQYIPVAAQGHEGTKPRDASGNPMRVCTFWETCPCNCHQKIDEMFAMTGSERRPAQQSAEYLQIVAENGLRHDQNMREIEDAVAKTALSIAVPAVVGGGMEGVSATVPGVAQGGDSVTLRPTARVFDPTPTGRRAKGQLEYEVLKVCYDFAAEVFDWELCTPKLVAERIATVNAIEPPSTGAINAVWNRWEALDFAKQDKKPSRFVGFTVDLEDGDPAIILDRLKSKTKREKKRGQAAQARVIRPVPSRKKK